MPDTIFHPLPWPLPDEEVREALAAAYADGSWGRYHGPNCAALVERLCEAFCVKHTMPCSSGTIGVELALRGCGVEAGDEVVLAGYDFSGNFRAIEAIGARPVLVDVSAESWCLDASQIEAATSPRIKAMIVSHLHGGIADMPKIMSIAQSRGWQVVEDACQQPGAQLAGRPVGSWGDVGVLSFGGSKLLTAGRGGAVLTDNAQIFQRMKVFSDRGNQAFPLSELQAAVLRPQLKKLRQRNQLRRDRVEFLRQNMTHLSTSLRPVAVSPSAEPAFYKFAWSYSPAETQPTARDELLAILHDCNAPIDVGFRGFAGRSARRCTKIGRLDVSARLSQSTVVLHHPVLLTHEKVVLQVANALDYAVEQLNL